MHRYIRLSKKSDALIKRSYSSRKTNLIIILIMIINEIKMTKNVGEGVQADRRRNKSRPLSGMSIEELMGSYGRRSSTDCSQ